jgi:hypothetical protein
MNTPTIGYGRRYGKPISEEQFRRIVEKQVRYCICRDNGETKGKIISAKKCKGGNL